MRVCALAAFAFASVANAAPLIVSFEVEKIEDVFGQLPVGYVTTIDFVFSDSADSDVNLLPGGGVDDIVWSDYSVVFDLYGLAPWGPARLVTSKLGDMSWEAGSISQNAATDGDYQFSVLLLGGIDPDISDLAVLPLTPTSTVATMSIWGDSGRIGEEWRVVGIEKTIVPTTSAFPVVVLGIGGLLRRSRER